MAIETDDEEESNNGGDPMNHAYTCNDEIKKLMWHTQCTTLLLLLIARTKFSEFSNDD